MPLTPGEADRLLLHLQASLARQRRERGLKLNVPEARALIADAVCESARDGLSWVHARDHARSLLTAADVLPGVIEALTEVRVEGRFDDGTRLVVVTDPFRARSTQDLPATAAEGPTVGTDISTDMSTDMSIEISNESSTDIGLSSHIHLAEVNPRLRLDRSAAFGMRAAVPAGSTIWIPAGGRQSVPMIPIAGARIAVGTTGLVDGSLDDPQVRDRALEGLRACGYLDLIEGEPFGNLAAADRAIEHLMALRTARRDQHGR